jgi:hypothetical protein
MHIHAALAFPTTEWLMRTTSLVEEMSGERESFLINGFTDLIKSGRVRGSVVVEALCFKPEGYGLETR